VSPDRCSRGTSRDAAQGLAPATNKPAIGKVAGSISFDNFTAGRE
jgi:hypothetical protein